MGGRYAILVTVRRFKSGYPPGCFATTKVGPRS